MNGDFVILTTLNLFSISSCQLHAFVQSYLLFPLPEMVFSSLVFAWKTPIPFFSIQGIPPSIRRL